MDKITLIVNLGVNNDIASVRVTFPGDTCLVDPAESAVDRPGIFS